MCYRHVKKSLSSGSFIKQESTLLMDAANTLTLVSLFLRHRVFFLPPCLELSFTNGSVNRKYKLLL